MFALVTPAAGIGASLLGASAVAASGLRRRFGRGAPTDGEPSAATAVPLRNSLFVSGTDAAGAFRGRATAVAVDAGDTAGADRTRYLVEDPGREEAFWVAETEIERSYPLLPGDTVLGYVTVRPGQRTSATRAAVAALRRACERSGWRLAGVVCDNERDAVLDRPGLARALDRIADREAAGLLVADVDRATGSEAGLTGLMGAVRGVGGGFAIVEDEDRVAPGATARRVARGHRSWVLRRIAELRAEGLAPRAVADALNEEGIPAPGGLLWQPWSVREAAGAWPPRGPDTRLPRGPRRTSRHG